MKILIIAILLAVPSLATAAELNLQNRLASAKPGQTITLPAGEFRGGVTLPAGVSLKGAGYGKTIIDAAGAEHGLAITNGGGAVISDLTVRGAAGANVLVRGAEKVVIRRVRATGGLIGVSLNDVRDGRVENVVSDGNRYGIIAAGGAGNVVVNCTAAGNASVGLSLSGERAAAFNNCVTESATAVVVGEGAKDLTLDHNLYTGIYIGKFKNQIVRRTMNDWRYLSSHDARSISIPVSYDGNFAVTNVLDWALDRTVTAGWGAAKLGGAVAPTDDIAGMKRPGTPGLGAVETTVAAPRPADGAFSVAWGGGLASAGVFDPNGKLLSYLFHTLPLSKGKHSFWLPSRSWKGRAIAAGEYEVRLVESKLDWEYAGWVANTGTEPVRGSSCPVESDALAVDEAGRLFVGRGLSEAQDNVLAFDAATGKWLWVLRGNAPMKGLAVGGDGRVYLLRADGNAARLTRLEAATRAIAPWSKTDYGQFALADGAHWRDMTALGDQLFYADPTNNVLHVGTLEAPAPTKTIPVNKPSSPAADVKAKLLWVISGEEKVIALSPDGKVVAETQPVAQPIAVAARGGRLAVASKQTGKVHLFDAANPAQLKPLGEIGRGDGPFGRMLPDRFMFQNGAMGVRLAFAPNGDLVVGEEHCRLQVFGGDGKVKWLSFSSGGWAAHASRLTPGRIFAGAFTLLADSETKTWQPETFHHFPGEFAGEFQVQGQTFMAFIDRQNGTIFTKFTPDKLTPAIGLISRHGSKDPWTWRVDSNGDGRINTNDVVVATVTDDKGQPVVKGCPLGFVMPDGKLTMFDKWVTQWPCAGLDKNGTPIYRFGDGVSIRSDASDLVSPYDFGAVGQPGFWIEPWQRPGGGWLGGYMFYAYPVKHNVLLPGAGDMIGVDKDGVVDWVHPFALYPDAPRVGSVEGGDGVYVASLTASYDCFALNPDGLLLEGFSMPSPANFIGHWVDHPAAVSSWLDKQGRLNLIAMDYMWNRNHWFILAKKDVREAKAKVTVNADAAARLAALPVVKLTAPAGKPPTPVVRIPQLKSPLPIDGDLQKWRAAGIEPQIILTPDNAFGIEGGPRDCSAIARLAYHGQDLYLQLLRFDDLVTLHQPHGRAYLGDAIEMCLNGFMEGIKFNMAMTSDLGPVNKVDSWNPPHFLIDLKHAPLVVKLLDNAESVTERQLIENIYGVSLRDCRVQVYETRIPMDATTFKGRKTPPPEMKPGTKFWLGFLIDDNDQPGTDYQSFYNWPVTYGTFSPMEDSAIAVLE